MARILIVDDHENTRFTLSMILKKEGFQLEEAEDGEKAITLITQDNFDLVLTDLKMEKVVRGVGGGRGTQGEDWRERQGKGPEKRAVSVDLGTGNDLLFRDHRDVPDHEERSAGKDDELSHKPFIDRPVQVQGKGGAVIKLNEVVSH